METIDATTILPLFEPNQVLSSTHLNQLRDYLDSDNRLSRTRLAGMGIVGGLYFEYQAAQHRFLIHPGYGITSDGFLLDLPHVIPNDGINVPAENVYTYGYFKAYKDPSEVPYGFGQTIVNKNNSGGNRSILDSDSGDSETQPGCYNPEGEPLININDLLTADEKIHNYVFELFTEAPLGSDRKPISNTLGDLNFSINEMALVLYCEANDVALKSCTGTNCDNKGKRRELTVRVLLVHRGLLYKLDAQKRLTRTEGPAPLCMPRIVAPNDKEKDSDQGNVNPLSLVETPKDLIELYIPLISGQSGKLEGAMDRFIKQFAWKLDLTVDRYDEAIQALHKISDSGEEYIQYAYDAVSDATMTWNELCDAVAEWTEGNHFLACGFPRHLCLGAVQPPEGMYADQFRNVFLSAPPIGKQDRKLLQVQMLWQKMLRCLQSFTLPRPSGDVSDIRITPSRAYPSQFTEWSIPYYYDAESLRKELLPFWNPVKSLRGRAHEQNGYFSPVYTKADPCRNVPLAYSLREYPFLRIEGIRGLQFNAVLDELNRQKNKYNLPFDVVALRLTEDGLFRPELPGCNDKDLEEEYLLNRRALLSLVDKLWSYLSAIRPMLEKKDEDPRKEEPGKEIPKTTAATAASDGTGTGKTAVTDITKDATTASIKTASTIGNIRTAATSSIKIALDPALFNLKDVSATTLKDIPTLDLSSLRKTILTPEEIKIEEDNLKTASLDFDAERFTKLQAATDLSAEEIQERNALIEKDAAIRLSTNKIDIAKAYTSEVEKLGFDEEKLNVLREKTDLSAADLEERDALLDKENQLHIYTLKLTGNLTDSSPKTGTGDSAKTIDPDPLPPRDEPKDTNPPLGEENELEVIFHYLSELRNDLKASLPICLIDFKYMDFKRVYKNFLGTVVSWATRHLLNEVLEDLVGPKVNDPFPINLARSFASEIIFGFFNQINHNKLYNVYYRLQLRYHRRYRMLRFGAYAAEHPGMEHLAGTFQNGTFIVVYEADPHHGPKKPRKRPEPETEPTPTQPNARTPEDVIRDAFSIFLIEISKLPQNDRNMILERLGLLIHDQPNTGTNTGPTTGGNTGPNTGGGITFPTFPIDPGILQPTIPITPFDPGIIQPINPINPIDPIGPIIDPGIFVNPKVSDTPIVSILPGTTTTNPVATNPASNPFVEIQNKIDFLNHVNDKTINSTDYSTQIAVLNNSLSNNWALNATDTQSETALKAAETLNNTVNNLAASMELDAQTLGKGTIFTAAPTLGLTATSFTTSVTPKISGTTGLKR